MLKGDERLRCNGIMALIQNQSSWALNRCYHATPIVDGLRSAAGWSTCRAGPAGDTLPCTWVSELATGPGPGRWVGRPTRAVGADPGGLRAGRAATARTTPNVLRHRRQSCGLVQGESRRPQRVSRSGAASGEATPPLDRVSRQLLAQAGALSRTRLCAITMDWTSQAVARPMGVPRGTPPWLQPQRRT